MRGKVRVNNMEQHELKQGSDAWHAYRSTHFNASDAAAMLGISKYKSRNELLREMATGIVEEIDATTQKRFDDGHRFEALARPFAEEITSKKLYPVVGSEGKLSASFDGLTMDESVCWEHKTGNYKLVDAIRAGKLSDDYLAQIEQQLMISGANKCLFMASTFNDEDEVIGEEHIWIESNQDMRDRIVQGWTQFAIDLEEYKRKLASGEIEPPKVEVIAAPILDLPAVSIQVNGSISLISNLDKFGARLTEFVEGLNKEPNDDQGFADAEAAIKTLQKAQDALEAAESNALAQTSDIDDMRKTVKLYADTARTTRLMLEKMVKARKESIRDDLVRKAGLEFSAHIESLEAETKPIQLNINRPDFAGAIKGKRTIASLKDAVDTALAGGKIAADVIAKDVRAKLTWYNETTGINNGSYGFLFHDLQQIISKPIDDFKLVVMTRIESHQKAEAEKLEAQHEEIRKQEEVKAIAKVQAEEQARIAAGVKAQLEAQAKAKAEEIKRDGEFMPTVKTIAEDRIAAELEATAIEEKRKRIQLEESAKMKGEKIEPWIDVKTLLEHIQDYYNISHGQACDLVLKVAEELRVAA